MLAHIGRVLGRVLPMATEAAMIATIRKSGYTGPLGILDHRNDTDAEIALKENLEGLKKVLK